MATSFKGSNHAEPRRRFDLLDEPLHRAGRERRALHRRQSEPQARPAGRRRPAVAAAGRHHRRSRGVRRALRRRRRRRTSSSSSRSTRENPNSILSCLRAARENARIVREIISSEMWEQINKFYLMVRDGGALDAARSSDPHEFFDAGEDWPASSSSGVTDATMTHGEAWHFCRLGRLLERADKTSRILDVKYFILLPKVADVGTPFDDIQWAALLRSASAFEMYRKRHGRISPTASSSSCCSTASSRARSTTALKAARESLHAISGTPTGMFRNPVEQRLGQLCSELAYAQVDEDHRQRPARVPRRPADQAEPGRRRTSTTRSSRGRGCRRPKRRPRSAAPASPRSASRTSWPSTSRCRTRPAIATTGRCRCRRRSSGCGRRRTAARRSSATR